MRQTLGWIGIAALTLGLGTALATMTSTRAFAQDAGGAAATGDQAAIQDAAKKAFQAIADSKIDDLWVLVQSKYDRKLSPAELRPGDTGPKLSVAFDGNVKVLRTGKNFAVVGANFFKPDSSDIPASEVSRLDLYMVDDHGSWKSARPTKKRSRLRWRQGRMVSFGLLHLLPQQEGHRVPAQSFQQQDRLRFHCGL